MYYLKQKEIMHQQQQPQLIITIEQHKSGKKHSKEYRHYIPQKPFSILSYR